GRVGQVRPVEPELLPALLPARFDRGGVVPLDPAPFRWRLVLGHVRRGSCRPSGDGSGFREEQDPAPPGVGVTGSPPTRGGTAIEGGADRRRRSSVRVHPCGKWWS